MLIAVFERHILKNFKVTYQCLPKVFSGSSKKVKSSQANRELHCYKMLTLTGSK